MLPGRCTTRAGTSSAVCGARKTNRFEDHGLASSAALATGPGPMGTVLTVSEAVAGSVASADTGGTVSSGLACFADVEWLCQNKPKPKSSRAAIAIAPTT